MQSDHLLNVLIKVLSILTRAVLEKIPDADGRPGDRLAEKVCELFGRVTSKVGNLFLSNPLLNFKT